MKVKDNITLRLDLGAELGIGLGLGLGSRGRGRIEDKVGSKDLRLHCQGFSRHYHGTAMALPLP